MRGSWSQWDFSSQPQIWLGGSLCSGQDGLIYGPWKRIASLSVPVSCKRQVRGVSSRGVCHKVSNSAVCQRPCTTTTLGSIYSVDRFEGVCNVWLSQTTESMPVLTWWSRMCWPDRYRFQVALNTTQYILLSELHPDEGQSLWLWIKRKIKDFGTEEDEVLCVLFTVITLTSGDCYWCHRTCCVFPELL